MVKLSTTIIGSLALGSEAAMLKKPTPAVMKLRGGLAGLDPTQVATAATYLSAVNAGIMSLAPEKAAEMYGMKDPSPVTVQMAEWAGGMMLMIAITSLMAIVGGGHGRGLPRPHEGLGNEVAAETVGEEPASSDLEGEGGVERAGLSEEASREHGRDDTRL